MTKRIGPITKAANVLKKAGCSDFIIAAKQGEGTDFAVYGRGESISYLLRRMDNAVNTEFFALEPRPEKVFKEAQGE